MITKEEIVGEIRKFVDGNDGEIPGERSFGKATGIKESSWKGRYWARWTDAVRAAGYDPNTLNQKIPDQEILQQLAAFISQLGHFPIREEINVQARSVSGFPVWQTVKNRYGGMPQTATALLDHAKKVGNAKLAALCEARLERESVRPVPRVQAKSTHLVHFGYVYLKYSPSLRLYKIGKANDHDKRGAGISLLLPEDLVHKHAIKTDYPYILEKYWEHRFRAKKKQGEWYDLASSDIETFKKRREFIFGEFFP